MKYRSKTGKKKMKSWIYWYNRLWWGTYDIMIVFLPKPACICYCGCHAGLLHTDRMKWKLKASGWIRKTERMIHIMWLMNLLCEPKARLWTVFRQEGYWLSSVFQKLTSCCTIEFIITDTDISCHRHFLLSKRGNGRVYQKNNYHWNKEKEPNQKSKSSRSGF